MPPDDLLAVVATCAVRRHHEHVQRARREVRLLRGGVFGLPAKVPRRAQHRIRALAERERREVELDRALVAAGWPRGAGAQPALQRSLAALAVAEEDEARARATVELRERKR